MRGPIALCAPRDHTEYLLRESNMTRDCGYWKNTYTNPTVMNADVSLAGSHCYQLAVLVTRDYVCATGHLIRGGTSRHNYVPIDRVVWC